MSRLDIERELKKLRWETYKAIAVFVVLIVAFAGIILAVAQVIR
jgi:hypothetical protein